MSNIILQNDLLLKSEIDYLKNICDNFNNDTKIGNKLNFYNRQKIDDNNLTTYKKKLKTILKEYHQNKEYNFTDSWINRVDNTQPIPIESDKFHLDISDLSIITFINDDYTGGQFSYLNNKNEEIIIEPKKNLTIILNGSELYHRVCSVMGGTRFTLISFLEYENKKNKTLL